MVCNKQFIILGHCEIWSHFTRTLYFHSHSARDNTVATCEISCHNWASGASPTLGCSIEILRDIIMLSVCRMSVVCQINCVGGITCGPRACSKSFFLVVKPVTPVLFISYTI